MESEIILHDALADPERLTPRAYPILVSVDPRGEYPDTVETEGDARDALARYVETGGALILYSRGGALKTAVIRVGSRYLRTTRDRGLAEALGLRIVHPEDRKPPGIAPLDRLPDRTGSYRFERNGAVPPGLAGLPRSIDAAPMLYSAYYPMTDESGEAEEVYRLVDETGAAYGPTLTIVPRSRGRIVVIDHTLWNSNIDGQPFHRAVLPTLMAWTVIEEPAP
jgi:hypothetical protein